MEKEEGGKMEANMLQRLEGIFNQKFLLHSAGDVLSGLVTLRSLMNT